MAWGFLKNSVNLFLSGLNCCAEMPGQSRMVGRCAGNSRHDPDHEPARRLSTAPGDHVMKGLLDLKSGKSKTGWSLIDRGAMYEDRPCGAEDATRGGDGRGGEKGGKGYSRVDSSILPIIGSFYSPIHLSTPQPIDLLTRSCPPPPAQHPARHFRRQRVQHEKELEDTR